MAKQICKRSKQKDICAVVSVRKKLSSFSLWNVHCWYYVLEVPQADFSRRWSSYLEAHPILESRFGVGNRKQSDEQRRRPTDVVVSLQSSARYGGNWPRYAQSISMAGSYSTQHQTGSQCRQRRTGLMWSRCRVPDWILAAAAFLRHCKRYMNLLAMPRSMQTVAVVQAGGLNALMTIPVSSVLRNEAAGRSWSWWQ